MEEATLGYVQGDTHQVYGAEQSFRSLQRRHKVGKMGQSNAGNQKLEPSWFWFISYYRLALSSFVLL